MCWNRNNSVVFRDKNEQKANKKRSLGENNLPSDILRKSANWNELVEVVERD